MLKPREEKLLGGFAIRSLLTLDHTGWFEKGKKEREIWLKLGPSTLMNGVQRATKKLHHTCRHSHQERVLGKGERQLDR